MKRMAVISLGGAWRLVLVLAPLQSALAWQAVPDGVSASDWSSIRAAYEANRHAAFAVEGGYQARNPGQQWTTRFDGRGFETKPDTGGWTWGLELERYGFAGAQHEVTKPKGVTADGQRVAYAWDDAIEEWYFNDGRGLEHGFTIRERPAASDRVDAGTLTLTLAVRGGLLPVVSDDGRSVSFTNGDGATALNYAGLSVFDADHRALAARFEREGSRLVLGIDQRGARYPLTIDPIAQQAYIKASNTGAGDSFGIRVSVSGDTLVVGAFLEDSAATGIDGNQADNSAPDSGAAYVFVRNGATWSQQAYLKASNTGADDWFGWFVSVSGDTVLVGANGEDSAATGVNGDQASNHAPNSGAAYVFVRNGTLWSQQAYLKASNTGAGDEFGDTVSISGDTLVVGAWFEDSAATGVDGNQADNSAPESGAAYVFVRNGAAWSQQAYLKASNTAAGDTFGFSASTFGDTILVGAASEDSSAPDSGASYVFVRSGTTWSQQAYLKASNAGAGDMFGFFVAISGDTAVVAAYLEDSAATGVDGDQSDNSAPDSGAAYVFVQSGMTWSQQAYLKASNTEGGDGFGAGVSISGDTIVVVAPGEDSAATGVDGTDSGAAYVFVRNGAAWSQQAYLKASNPGAGDWMSAVSISGDTVVVSAQSEDSAATGIDGNQADNSAPDSGAVYAFDLAVPEPWTDLGSGLPGVSGIPQLTGFGDLLVGTPGAISLASAAPSALALLFVSTSSTPTPFKGGTLLTVPVLLTLPLSTDSQGDLLLPWTAWPSGASGVNLFLQYAIQDSAAVKGAALSNALGADVP